MHPLFTQIKTLIQQQLPDTTLPITHQSRRAILQAILPLCPSIPHPASGNTLLRWQILAQVAGVDLTLVKWLESHLDALSILHELGYETFYLSNPNKLWAVWAAEGHPTPVQFFADGQALGENRWVQGTCEGVKAWCSGANIVDFALMTYRDTQHYSQLVIIDTQKSSATVRIDDSVWQAVGMQGTDTATISFHHTPATQIGQANDYLNRAGFWQGGAGVAACWYGATVAIADYLQRDYQQKTHPFKAMYLGQVSSQLAVLQQYFYHVARLIDSESNNSESNNSEPNNSEPNHSEPNHSHVLAIRQLRQQVEVTSRFVLDQVGQALGAAPFCQNAHFARLSADLAVFIRQSHGAFDSQAIGEMVSDFSKKLAEKLTETEQESVWQL